MAKSKPKSRNFAFILYPESLSDNWIDKLESLGIPMAISPLHDKDKKEISESTDVLNWSAEELELFNSGKLFKKAHYHVMYCAPNPVTVESIRNKVKRCLGDSTISHIEIVDNVLGYYKYLTHESTDAVKKNKHKYDKKDLVHLSNFDIDRYVTLDDAEKKDLFNKIVGVIREQGIENIIDLSDYILVNGKDIGVSSISVLNDVISTKTGLLRLYFDGVYQTRKRGRAKQFLDEETGEIID